MTMIALVVGAAGIVIPIFSGAESVSLLGVASLLVPAVVIWLGPWRWTPIIGALAAVQQIIGLFAAGQASQMVDPNPLGNSVGLWIQLAARTVATVTGFAAVAVLGERARTPGCAA